MKLCFDNIIYHLQNSGGISKYWYELASRFIKSADLNFIEYSSCSDNFFRKQLNLPTDNIEYDKVRPVVFSRYLPVFNKIEKDRIFHSSYYRVTADKSIKSVVTVHDFTYEHFFKGLKKYVHGTQKSHAVRRADRVICISESTKRDLLHFYPDVDPEMVDVVYNGVNEDFRKLDSERGELKSKHGLEQTLDYAIYVGSRTFYKNFDLAVKVCAEVGIGLVVVGGGEFSAGESQMVKTLLGDKCIHKVESVNVETLNELYNACKCLLYPSSYEGFGIPPAEAIKAGCIPLVQNVSSLPEVIGDNGLLCDSASVECFADNLSKIINGDMMLSDTNKSSDEVFTWDRCYADTLRVYQTLVSTHK